MAGGIWCDSMPVRWLLGAGTKRATRRSVRHARRPRAMTDVERTAVGVISLRAAHDRRATFAAFAADTSVPWSFIDALTALAPPLHYDESDARRVHGRTLTEGELGSYASHVAAWEWLLESQYQQLIVFEDDVVVDWPLIAPLRGEEVS